MKRFIRFLVQDDKSNIMKYFFLIVLVLGLRSAFCQSEKTQELVSLYKTEALPGSESNFTFHADLQQLEIGDHLIPLSDNTHLSVSKEQVNFMLQKGTAVTSKTDPSYRRAFYSIEFKSKKAAKRFLMLLEQLKNQGITGNE